MTLVSCDTTKYAINTTVKLMERSAPHFERESDVDLMRAAIPGQLTMLESFLYVDPENPKLLFFSARGYCDYSYGFLEDDLETLELGGRFAEADHLTRRLGNLYLRCRDYALRLLGKSWEKDFHKNIQAFEKRVKNASKSDVPGMFYVARGMGSAIQMMQEDMEMVAYLPVVKLLFERCVQLDEKYMFAGGHMALGGLNASIPEAFGGNTQVAKKHFDRAIELTQGKLLMFKVLYATMYAKTVQDRTLFHSTLEQVLGTPTNTWPEYRLANELAHIRARRYLAQEGEWF
jgi:hypothetical protein